MNYTVYKVEKKIPTIVREKFILKVLLSNLHYHGKEWSGIVFYKIKGKLFEKGFSIEVLDLLPMAKGSQAFTEFEYGPEYVKYLNQNPELMEGLDVDISMGFVHSHHNMETFFSGTDKNDLYDGTEANNAYFSIIVNDDLKFNAKIATRQAPIPTEKLVVRNHEGEPVEVTISKKPEIINANIVYSDCKISLEAATLKYREYLEYFKKIERPNTYKQFNSYGASKKAETFTPKNEIDFPPITLASEYMGNFDSWDYQKSSIKSSNRKDTYKNSVIQEDVEAIGINLLPEYKGRVTLRRVIESAYNEYMGEKLPHTYYKSLCRDLLKFYKNLINMNPNQEFKSKINFLIHDLNEIHSYV